MGTIILSIKRIKKIYKVISCNLSILSPKVTSTQYAQAFSALAAKRSRTSSWTRCEQNEKTNETTNEIERMNEIE